MKVFLHIAKAVADETRLRILMLLHDGELCVCNIVETLELAPSTVSKHMSILTHAGLVEVRKAGRWRYFRLARRDAPVAVRSALDWVQASLKGSLPMRKDAKRLKMIQAKKAKQPCEH